MNLYERLIFNGTVVKYRGSITAPIKSSFGDRNRDFNHEESNSLQFCVQRRALQNQIISFSGLMHFFSMEGKI